MPWLASMRAPTLCLVLKRTPAAKKSLQSSFLSKHESTSSVLSLQRTLPKTPESPFLKDHGLAFYQRGCANKEHLKQAYQEMEIERTPVLIVVIFIIMSHR